MKKRYLFLYLDTGAGHISTAKIIKTKLEELYPEDEVFLLNGFHPKQKVEKLFFEQGYRSSCNYLPGAYSLMFNMQKSRFALDMLKHTFSLQTANHIAEKIKEWKITDVVSFHFLLTHPAKLAIRKFENKIPLSVIVSDPFSAPTIWFHFPDVHYLVSSQEAKKIALKHKVPEKNIHLMPLIINENFTKPYTQEDVNFFKEKYNISKTKKTVLLVGGGEGLPGAINIIKEAIKENANFSIIMVCGRDKETEKKLKTIQKKHPNFDLKVYGFVNFLDDLIKICDCAVIKAGPATMLEIISSKKPVIICKYMHQEIGNMHFATRNKLGWYISKPKNIYNKIEELFSSPEKYNKIISNIEKTKINTNISEICHHLAKRTQDKIIKN